MMGLILSLMAFSAVGGFLLGIFVSWIYEVGSGE